MNLEGSARILVNLLASSNSTVSCAESCTGGLVAGAITSIPGASAVFKGGVVAYADEAKINILGVEPGILQNHGSVSMECAGAMAKGVAQCFSTDFSISITGVAGPDGGSAEKPVGTVWFGLACRGKISTFKEHFTGNRGTIRMAAAQRGLDLITASVNSCFELDNPTDGGVSLSQE